tara:strand:- start:413 stop:595 length:183 start_codon:yes stop_codon:yes gene_type:complete
MGTNNKIMFKKTLDKYKKTGQIRVDNNQLEILEKDNKKRDEIIWELASYSPQFALQMIGG